MIYCTSTNEIIGANASIALSTYDLSSEGVQDPDGGDKHCSCSDSKQKSIRAPVPWLHPPEEGGLLANHGGFHLPQLMRVARVDARVRKNRVCLLTSTSPPFVKNGDLLAPKLGRPNFDMKGKGRDDVKFGIGLHMRWRSRWRQLRRGWMIV